MIRSQDGRFVYAVTSTRVPPPPQADAIRLSCMRPAYGCSAWLDAAGVDVVLIEVDRMGRSPLESRILLRHYLEDTQVSDEIFGFAR